ncbi:MAG: hypothetical protein AAB263_05060 [Planctomycetota bacterium]
MADTDIRAARDRIDTVEKRLAALQDAGMNTGVLRAQLAFAHGALREGRLADVEPICEEVLSAARQLAEVGQRGSTQTTQYRTPAPGTESVQRVKVGRAQIADEVRAVIEAEVKLQAVTRPDLSSRMDQFEQRLEEIMRSAADAAAVAGRLHAIDARLASAESNVPGVSTGAAQDIEAVVAKAVAEAVPRQASELLRQTISQLPTRDDLQQIAETLRADLDWRLEKAAAEHGWCSLADVQTSVRKALSEQDPGTFSSGSSHLARLEGAMAEFVQHSREQQERLIAALADRVAQHTRGLTKKMLVRESDAFKKAAPTPESANTVGEPQPTSQSDRGSSSARASVTGIQQFGQDKSSFEPSLDPLPPEVIAQTRQHHGDTTNFTVKVPAASGAAMPADPKNVSPDVTASDLQDIVSNEVDRVLAAGAVSTMKTAEEISYSASASSLAPHSIASTSIGALSSGNKQAIALPTSSVVNPNEQVEVQTIVTAEVARQMAHLSSAPVPGEGELVRAIVRALPIALQDPAVRTEIFAMLGLEAATKPGILGELTGLRRYLKREVLAAAQDVAKNDTAIVKVE